MNPIGEIVMDLLNIVWGVVRHFLTGGDDTATTACDGHEDFRVWGV
jgi:hypothetical protein